MKYYVYSANAKRGDKPLRVLEYEPNDILVASMAAEYGPIEVLPEFIQVKPDKSNDAQIEEHIQTLLPSGVKTSWKKIK